MEALQRDAVARRVLAKGESPEVGQLVGVRLNINVMKNTGIAAHSIHRATSLHRHETGSGFYRGEVISYLPVVRLKHAYFSVSQSGREAIASHAQSKFPIASVDGEFCKCAKKPNCDGIEVSFNPMGTHLFLDEDGYAVQYGEDVTILGHRAYVRGAIRYFGEDTAPERRGDALSMARFREGDLLFSLPG